MALPIGFRFLPTDQQLFKDYLIHKVTEHEELLPWDGIEDIIMYGSNAEPWNVFHDADSWDEAKETKKVKKSKYFFTQLRKVSDGGINFARSAGGGIWHGETSGDPKGDNIYGTKKLFTYRAREVQDNSVKWLMHEYALSDRFLKSIGVSTRANYYVLCKITKVIDLSKKATTVYDDQQQHDEVLQENQDLLGKRKYMTAAESDGDNFMGQDKQEIKKARVNNMENVGSDELACKVASDEERSLEIEETILNQETTPDYDQEKMSQILNHLLEEDDDTNQLDDNTISPVMTLEKFTEFVNNTDWNQIIETTS